MSETMSKTCLLLRAICWKTDHLFESITPSSVPIFWRRLSSIGVEDVMVMMLVGYGLIVIIVSESAFYEERRGGLWWLDGPARPNASSFHVFTEERQANRRS